MAFLQIQHLTFRYPGDRSTALDCPQLNIDEGQFIVICGPSGSGKSTLLRHLKPELAPAGERAGDVLLRGKSLYSNAGVAGSRQIGMVLQDPESQIVSDQVLTELVFGMESHGVRTEEMRQRVAELVHFFGMEDWLHFPTHTLSGGQKQLLNLASVMALQPDVLLLDEPTSQLDPVASRQLLHWLQRLNEEFGMTIILSEHRLDECIPMADRVLMMQGGRMITDASPSQFVRDLQDSGEQLQLYAPIPSRLYYALSKEPQGVSYEPVPLTVKEGRDWFQSVKEHRQLHSADPHIKPKIKITNPPKKQAVLTCSEISYKYAKQDPWILRNLHLTCSQGELICVFGANGSGKSTLLHILAGFRKPLHGKIRLLDHDMYRMKDKELYRNVSYLAQNPLLHFVYDTVEEELKQAASRSELPDPDGQVEEWLDFFQLQSLRKQHPYDLSGGERQKAALASVMMSRPNLLLLDEPTKGLDPIFKQQLGERLSEMRKQGVTIIMVTHDAEFAADYASRCLLLFGGEITSEGSPAQFFSSHYFYTTTVNRIVRSRLPQGITIKDVLETCG